MIGRKTGGRRKGTPDKRFADLAGIIERAISTEERMQLLGDLARGIKLQDTATEVIYTTRPDRDAIKQLNEYQYGRPPQPIQGDADKPLAIKLTIETLT